VLSIAGRRRERGARPSRPRRKRQAGLALALVLIALLIVTMLGASLVRTVTIQHQQARVERDRRHSFYLVESGIDRARAALEANTKYQGELWQPWADLHPTGVTASVDIKASPMADQPDRFRVLVEARYASQSAVAAVSRREVRLHIHADAASSTEKDE